MTMPVNKDYMKDAPVDRLDLNVIHHGDCLEVMKSMPDNSVDAIVTDPPYGLGKQPDTLEMLISWLAGEDYKPGGAGFMGKKWDAFVPNPSVWKECIRVLKPGGHLLSFFGSRTFDLGVLAIRLAGFEIRDTVYWCHGSGFPKSLNIGLAVDKERGFPDRGHRIAVANRHHPDGTLEPNGEYLPEYEPQSEDGKRYKGLGTGLKPAVEPIVLARKPIEKGLTIAGNVLKWGTGALDIDGTRVGNETIVYKNGCGGGKNKINRMMGGNIENDFNFRKKEWKQTGRFPSHLILDDSAEVEAIFPMSGNKMDMRTECKAGNPVNVSYGGKKESSPRPQDFGGSASRYFKKIPSRVIYQSKPSKSERNKGCEGMEDKVKAMGNQAAAEIKRGNNPVETIDKKSGMSLVMMKNHHPTVKSTALCEYLITLISRDDQIVLDPFAGSGSTLIAAKRLGRRWIGIEQEAEYVAIAKARLDDTEKTVERRVVGNEVREQVIEQRELL